jgi:hypothetical protein
MNLIRKHVRRVFKKGGLAKNTHSRDLLGCSPRELELHLQRKIDLWNAACPERDTMHRSTVHIDHIKPARTLGDSLLEVNSTLLTHVDRCLREGVDDDTMRRIKEICHYTNLQPLTPRQNLAKQGRWTPEDELFWREHVLFQPMFTQIYMGTSTA